MNYIQQYYEKMKSGEIIACKKIIKIYKKLVDDIKNPKDGFFFCEELALKPIDFIETFCKLSDGKMGTPLKLELFQKAYIQALFGFVDANRYRRFRESIFMVGRKNGKTEMLAALALFMLMADGESSANIFSAATKRDQAKLVFDATVKMVKQSPELSMHLTKRKTDLYFPINFSKFEPLASEAKTLEGLNSHMIIVDELHSLKTRETYDVLKRSMAAMSRKQPLMLMITTAGTVRESIFDETYAYATKVLDGIVHDNRFLPILYELDDRKEWTNSKMYIKANPGLGIIKSWDYLNTEIEKTKVNPNNLSELLCKDFNLPQTSVSAWLQFDDINNQETFEMEDIKNSYAIGGADLSATTDLTCATLIIMKAGSNKKYILQQYFLPAGIIERRVIEDKTPYDKWAERGLLTLCDGNKINYSDVTKWFVKMRDEYKLYVLWTGFDPWNSNYWLDDMKNNGFVMEVVRQGAKTLSVPMKNLEGDLMERNIIYNDNPILKWCLVNTAVKRDINDNIQPTKGTSSRNRIDGAVSLIIAYTLLLQHMQDYINYI